MEGQSPEASYPSFVGRTVDSSAYAPVDPLLHFNASTSDSVLESTVADRSGSSFSDALKSCPIPKVRTAPNAANIRRAQALVPVGVTQLRDNLTKISELNKTIEELEKKRASLQEDTEKIRKNAKDPSTVRIKKEIVEDFNDSHEAKRAENKKTEQPQSFSSMLNGSKQKILKPPTLPKVKVERYDLDFEKATTSFAEYRPTKIKVEKGDDDEYDPMSPKTDVETLRRQMMLGKRKVKEEPRITGDKDRCVARTFPAKTSRPSVQQQLMKTLEKATERGMEQEKHKTVKKTHLTFEQLYGESSSRIGSNLKGEKRIARVVKPVSKQCLTSKIKTEPDTSPKKKKPALQPPTLLAANKSKIPYNVRIKYLAKLFDQYTSNGELNAREKAQEAEREIAMRTNTHTSYCAAVVTKIKRLRDAAGEHDVVVLPKNAVSHDEVLGGRGFKNVSVGIKRKNLRNVDNMTDDELYQQIKTLQLSVDELESNGYPMLDMRTNETVFKPTQYDSGRTSWVERSDLRRTCVRCKIDFTLPEDGAPVELVENTCRFHNRGRKITGKRDSFRKTHACCGIELNTDPGCKFAQSHVFDCLYSTELANFETTPSPVSPDDPRSRKVYALDCEMVYTIEGSALARLSVADIRGRKVLDVMVRPPSQILDANTEFSGLTKEQVEAAPVDWKKCRDELFSLINSETILIGHSLESDLKAMRVIHPTVVDTSIIFSKDGRKRALRDLSSNLLQRFIQQDVEDQTGHCSFEDAKTCIDLVMFRLKDSTIAL